MNIEVIGIALTDVVGMDAFYETLICILPSCLMACVMTVVIRMCGDKAIAHYQKLKSIQKPRF